MRYGSYNSKKRMLALSVVLAVIVLAAIVALIFVLKDKDDISEVIDTPVDIIEKYEVLRVNDYTNGNVTRELVGMYESNSSVVRIYENGIYIGYDATATVTGERLEMSLEETTDISIESFKTDIENVYNLEMTDQIRYVATKVKNGEKLIRTVEAVNYTEVYTSKGDEVTRYLMSSDTLIIGEYKKNALPGVTSYFNYVVDTE